MITASHTRAARDLLGWSQEELSRHSGVSKEVIARLEVAGGNLGGFSGLQEKVIAALESAGVEFFGSNGSGGGVRLRKDRVS